VDRLVHDEVLGRVVFLVTDRALEPRPRVLERLDDLVLVGFDVGVGRQEPAADGASDRYGVLLSGGRREPTPPA